MRGRGLSMVVAVGWQWFLLIFIGFYRFLLIDFSRKIQPFSKFNPFQNSAYFKIQIISKFNLFQNSIHFKIQFVSNFYYRLYDAAPENLTSPYMTSRAKRKAPANKPGLRSRELTQRAYNPSEFPSYPQSSHQPSQAFQLRQDSSEERG